MLVVFVLYLVSLLLRPQPSSTLFPYTTLFRSIGVVGSDAKAELARKHGCRHVLISGRDELVAGVVDHRHARAAGQGLEDRKSTRLNSSHVETSYAVFCLKKKTPTISRRETRFM